MYTHVRHLDGRESGHLAPVGEPLPDTDRLEMAENPEALSGSVNQDNQLTCDDSPESGSNISDSHQTRV